MTRPSRIEFCGAVYHVTSRGNEQKPVFIDDRDRTKFLDLLLKTLQNFNWICHAYCLMGNHYHLVIETIDATLSKGMQYLNGVYTQLFNSKYRRVGHLFQGRYKSILIEKDRYLLAVCRYIILNPVRAGIVSSPDRWRWSSYRSTIGIERPHPCLSICWILDQFDKSLAQARIEYCNFINDRISKKPIVRMVKDQKFIGGKEFASKLTGYIKEEPDNEVIPGDQRVLDRPSLNRLFNENLSRLNRNERNNKIYEAVNRYGYTQNNVADFLKLHYTTISRIMRLYQEMGSDP